MKKIILFLSAMFIIVLTLSACGKQRQYEIDNNKSPKNQTKTELQSDSNDSLNIETVAVSELTKNPEKIKDCINACENLIMAEDMEIMIPEIEHVYTFNTGLTKKPDFKTQYSQFGRLFKSLYDDYEMKGEYLFYTGEDFDSYEEFTDYPIVRDDFDSLNSGSKQCMSLFYDETWYRDMTEWTSPVSLGIGRTMEFDTVIFNRGKAVGIGGKVNGIYPCLDYYSPYDSSFECVGTYPPDSTEKFKLMDKEMSICDAVKFYENYINSLPYPAEPTMQVKVKEVDVLALSENTYGYSFIAVEEYCGLTFDYRRTSHNRDYMDCEFMDTMYLNGFMLESDEADIGCALYRTQITDRTEIEALPAKTAIEKISEELSDYVKFEVESIEFVYTRIPERTSEGYIDIETPSAFVAPAWKLKLYNPNDQLYYFCYVDAKDSQNFSYYTTEGN